MPILSNYHGGWYCTTGTVPPSLVVTCGGLRPAQYPRIGAFVTSSCAFFLSIKTTAVEAVAVDCRLTFPTQLEVNVPIECQYQLGVTSFHTPIARDLLHGNSDCLFASCWW